MFDYIRASIDRKIPAMVFRLSKEEWIKLGLDEMSAELISGYLLELENQGFPLLDHLRSMPLDRSEGRLDYAKRLFDELPAGITHFIIHPSKETDEIKAISPDWESRVGDYRLMMDDEIFNYLKDKGIHVIGYNYIKQQFQQSVINIS